MNTGPGIKVSRRTMLIAVGAAGAGARPSHSLAEIIGPSADNELIATVERCIRLYRQHETALEAAGDDDDTPALRQLDDIIAMMCLTVRRTKAVTLPGLLAKAQLFRRLESDAAIRQAEFKRDVYRADPDLLGQSIIHDLMQIAEADRL